jgi:hypothetical protein
MDNAYVIALVYAWLVQNPTHFNSWVRPFTQLRWSNEEKKLIATRVGGHWRRLANWARVLPTLHCVCKFERIARPRYMSTPVSAVRQRWNEYGDYVPRRYRVLVFV